MNEFKSVNIVKKANVYFDGKVTSRTVLFADGSKKTLGYMLPGEYEFNTGAPEIMETLSGECEIQLAGGGGWTKYPAGMSCQVPGNSKFKIRVSKGYDYCCSFQ